MRPLNEAVVAVYLTAFEGHSKVSGMKRWSISLDVARGFCSSLIRLSKFVPTVEMLMLLRSAPLITSGASLALPACGRAAPHAKKSAGELRRRAHNRCAAVVRAAHNQSFERTRAGILQLGTISFLPNRSLPARAAQLQR
jgi:hypothetical protein